jgi:hypothetical protein
MSPIEIAKAFNAPILRDAGDNAKPEEMLRSVKGRKVQYGANMTAGSAATSSEDLSRRGGKVVQVQESPIDGFPRRRLYLGPHGMADFPRPGETFE